LTVGARPAFSGRDSSALRGRCARSGGGRVSAQQHAECASGCDYLALLRQICAAARHAAAASGQPRRHATGVQHSRWRIAPVLRALPPRAARKPFAFALARA
jgi:hypothetical protein